MWACVHSFGGWAAIAADTLVCEPDAWCSWLSVLARTVAGSLVCRAGLWDRRCLGMMLVLMRAPPPGLGGQEPL